MELRYLEEDISGSKELSVSSFLTSHGCIRVGREIDASFLDTFFCTLQYMARNPQINEVFIYINSPGGAVIHGLTMIDLLNQFPKPVNLVCVGTAYSMAAVILASGVHGRRFVTENSRIMIHEPLISNTGGSATSIQTTAEMILREKENLIRLLADYCNKSTKNIREAIAYDHFMTAEEAISFGLCDYIAGKEQLWLI